jgi:HEPN domain-containing protein
LYFDFNIIPFTHNIDRLVGPIADKIHLHIHKETWYFLGELSKYAVDKGYPDYKRIMSQKATRHEALRLFNLSKEAFAWLQTLKPSDPKPDDTPR